MAALEERVQLARVRLQQITELHPAFERRVQTLVALVQERDELFSGDDRDYPPAA
jgi:hypothetical protein